MTDQPQIPQSLEDEKKKLNDQIEIQQLKNKLLLLKDGTFEHFLYGLLKIIDNPLLLVISVIMFFVGYLLRE